MSDIGRWVIWGVLPSIVAGVVINSLFSFETIDSALLGTIINDPVFRVTGLTIALVVPVYYSFDYLIDMVKSIIERRQKIQSSNSPGGFLVPSRPSSPLWEGVVRRYGVDWFVAVDLNQNGHASTYIDKGPCCPKCQIEMLRRNEPKLVVLKRRIWLCPECKTTIDRPSDVLFEEEKGVENIVEKHITTASNMEDPDEYIQSVEGVDTREWGRRLR